MDAIPQRYYWRHPSVPSRVLSHRFAAYALDCTTFRLFGIITFGGTWIFGFRPPRLASSDKKSPALVVGLFFLRGSS